MEAGLYTAIPRRHSVRAYDGRTLRPEDLAAVEAACAEPLDLVHGTRVVQLFGHTERVFTGLAIRNAPCSLAMIGQADIPQVEARVGYHGEHVVLAATAAGLGTCWVTATFHPEVVVELVDLRPGERVFAASPLGYEGRPGMVETFFNRMVTKSRERQPLETLVLPGSRSPAEAPPWMLSALKAARLAPSAYNRQPWRFTLGDDSITISLDSATRDVPTAPRAMDCGMAMRHLDLAAAAAGVTGTWEFLTAPNVAIFRGRPVPGR